MRIPILITLLVFISTACSITASEPQPSPLPVLEGEVAFTFPLSGTIIYSEVLFLSGTASGLPEDRFRVELIAPDETIIAQSPPVTVTDGRWQIEMPHGYDGEPTEVVVQAVPDDTQFEGSYAATLIILDSEDNRPDGIFGSITSPAEGDTIGGDSIEVRGTGSGFFEGSFVLELAAEDGAIIDSHPETIMNPYFVDDVPWVAELSINGYTGTATIRAYHISPRDGEQETFAAIAVTVVEEAG